MSKIKRPEFFKMQALYPKGTPGEVLKLIGGKVLANNFANTCAIRVSRSFNYSGVSIDYIPPNLTVSGSDGRWYIYRVKEMIKFLNRSFGEPDVSVVNKPYQDAIRGKKGIIVFEVDEWNDATGHVTLWDGNICLDKCYFPISKKVMLWELK